MDTEQSRALVKSAWSVFATRDASKIAELFTDEAEWLAPADNATALALNATHHMVGAQVIAEFIAVGVWRLFIDPVIEFRGVHADGNVVIVEERMTARLSNGSSYVNDYCFVFECRDGRISRVREYMDTQRGHRQIFAHVQPPHEQLAGQ